MLINFHLSVKNYCQWCKLISFYLCLYINSHNYQKTNHREKSKLFTRVEILLRHIAEVISTICQLRSSRFVHYFLEHLFNLIQNLHTSWQKKQMVQKIHNVFIPHQASAGNLQTKKTNPGFRSLNLNVRFQRLHH